MRYRVVAVGSMKRGPLAEVAQRYAKLLSGAASLESIEVRDRSSMGSAGARAAHDADALRHADGHLLLVDEAGEQLTTRQLADKIGALENGGVSRITLFIGGPDGHGEELRRAADGALGLSRLTLPHDLARVVLLEQLYRVESLRSGHPYHRV